MLRMPDTCLFPRGQGACVCDISVVYGHVIYMGIFIIASCFDIVLLFIEVTVMELTFFFPDL